MSSNFTIVETRKEKKETANPAATKEREYEKVKSLLAFSGKKRDRNMILLKTVLVPVRKEVPQTIRLRSRTQCMKR